MRDNTATRTLKAAPRETTHDRLGRLGITLHRVEYSVDDEARVAWVYARAPLAAAAILRARLPAAAKISATAQADDSGLRASRRALVLWPEPNARG